ncbi:MAG: hypothetical protein PHO12_08975 [Bacteroidales bacterium]|nr:hypothetical protein [Bacteroidales bacterium]MDD4685159.1 hypothetical protein [Bacteroidales bacterium]
MTTKELEKKLKISEKTWIHCPTLELAKQVLSIFHQLGLRWNNETSYVLDHNWDAFKGNTLYYPFEGGLSALGFANLTGYKIINAEEFIALHTEEEKFNLENYEPKGQLIGFPKEIIARMLECQEEQGNSRDISVFEKQCNAGCFNKGFTWEKTKEGNIFWLEVIGVRNFDIFFERYPKKDNSQEFRIGDEVIDIYTRQRGKIFRIDTNNKNIFIVYVNFNEKKDIYTLDGRLYFNDKYPRLLHYRDDYDYSIIDFNNLPKRQKPKRWRAENGEVYYFICFQIEGWFYTTSTKENNSYYDNIDYNSGNYFRTEIEAEIIAQKLNTYFKQLIQEEHEH